MGFIKSYYVKRLEGTHIRHKIHISYKRKRIRGCLEARRNSRDILFCTPARDTLFPKIAFPCPHSRLGTDSWILAGNHQIQKASEDLSIVRGHHL